MVFDPTFHSIDEEAENLPDLAGGPGDTDVSDPDGGIAEASVDRTDERQDDVIEGEAEAALLTEVLPADDLPPYGEE